MGHGPDGFGGPSLTTNLRYKLSKKLPLACEAAWVAWLNKRRICQFPLADAGWGLTGTLLLPRAYTHPGCQPAPASLCNAPSVPIPGTWIKRATASWQDCIAVAVCCCICSICESNCRIRSKCKCIPSSNRCRSSHRPSNAAISSSRLARSFQ